MSCRAPRRSEMGGGNLTDTMTALSLSLSLSLSSQEQSVPISVLCHRSRKRLNRQKREERTGSRRQKKTNETKKRAHTGRGERRVAGRANGDGCQQSQSVVGQGNLSKTACCLPDRERRGFSHRVDACRVNWFFFKYIFYYYILSLLTGYC
jgi:hypothetical protein